MGPAETKIAANSEAATLNPHPTPHTLHSSRAGSNSTSNCSRRQSGILSSFSWPPGPRIIATIQTSPPESHVNRRRRPSDMTHSRRGGIQVLFLSPSMVSVTNKEGPMSKHSMLVVLLASAGWLCALSTASAGRTPFTAFAHGAALRRSNPIRPKYAVIDRPVSEVEMKPDLEAKIFSPQNAHFFANLSNMAYSPHKEAEGLVVGNSTCEGAGFDSFYWFEGGEKAKKSPFDAIHDTEAFVAANDDIIAVVFRGTKEIADWYTNFNFSPRECSQEWGLPACFEGTVHEGFDDGVSSVWEMSSEADANNVGSSGGMRAKIKELYHEEGKNRKLYIAGHSLGGALATITAARLAFIDDLNIAAIYTIGCPRLFNEVAATYFDTKENHGTLLKEKHFRCRNNNDIVTRIPGFPYSHVGTEIYFDRFGTISSDNIFDRLLGRASAYLRGEFVEDIRDHATSEYVRLLRQVIYNSKLSIASKAASLLADSFGAVAQKVAPGASALQEQKKRAEWIEEMQ